MVETEHFQVAVLEHASSEPNGLSKRAPQWIGPKAVTVVCKACGEEWTERSAGALSGAIGHVEIECPECHEEEMIPTGRFAP